MLKWLVKSTDESGPSMAMIGLSHANLDALRDGRPIHLKGEDAEALGLGVEVVIYAGEDEVTMTADLVNRGMLAPEMLERARAEFQKHERSKDG